MSEILSVLADRLDMNNYRSIVMQRELRVYAQCARDDATYRYVVVQVIYVHRGEQAGYAVCGGVVLDDGRFFSKDQPRYGLDAERALAAVEEILAPGLAYRQRMVGRREEVRPVSRKAGLYGRNRRF